MDDKELDLDLDQIEVSEDKKLQARNRYQQLATAKNQAQAEKEAAETKVKEAEAKSAQLEKEREFYKNFSQISSKYPQATDYQDQILERVNKGADVEEATLGLLAKEGKLTAPPVRTPQAEGGSAVTNVSGEDKPLNELTANEKLSQLQDLEKSGELTQILRAGINRS